MAGGSISADCQVGCAMDARWATVRQCASGARAAVLAGVGSSTEAGLSERALSLLEDGSEGRHRDARAQGALSALLLGQARKPLLELWLEQGVGFALTCAAHERKLVAAHAKKPSGGLDLSRRWLEPRADEQIPISLDVETWEALAAAFRRASKEDRAQAQQAAREARAGAPVGLALWLDGIAGLGAEAVTDGMRALAPRLYSGLEPWLLTLVPTIVAAKDSPDAVALLDGLLARVNAGALNRLAPSAKALVALVGGEAVERLMVLMGQGREVLDRPSARRIAEVIAASGHPDVALFFKRNLESPLFGDVAAAFIAQQRAAPAALRSRAQEIQQDAQALHELRSTRAKKVAKATTRAKARTSALSSAPEAREDELPWLLREAPWRNHAAVPPLPALQLGPEPAFEPQLHLTDADRAALKEGLAEDEDDPVALVIARGAAALPAVLEMPASAAQLNALRRLECLAVARVMIDNMSGKLRAVAQAYARTHPSVFALALMGLLFEDERRLDRRRLLELLGELLRADEASVKAACARWGVSAAASEQIVSAARSVSVGEAPELPTWLKARALPPIVLANGSRLSEDATLRFLELLALREPRELKELREACDQVALDAFLSALFDAWVRSRSQREDWVLHANAGLGGALARRGLVRTATAWAKERRTRERAGDLIHALELAGMDAVSELGEIVRKGPRLLAEIAQEVLGGIAKREGATAEEVADRAVPTLDLDSRGRATVDFGSRRFEVVLGDDLSARVIDEQGKTVSALRVNKLDDPAKARIGMERIRALKKQLSELATSASYRLEQAMITGRSWRAPIFQSTLLSHPILGSLARRLIWVRSGGDEPSRSFRVAEDQSLATVDDEALELAPHHTLELAHPLTHALDAWSGVMLDYGILQPFPQIGRGVFRPTAEELEANVLSRFRGRPALQMAIMGRLKARGWERVSSFNVTTGFTRELEGVTATYSLVDEMSFDSELVNETTLGVVTFSVPITQVPAIAFSEAVYDLQPLGS